MQTYIVVLNFLLAVALATSPHGTHQQASGQQSTAGQYRAETHGYDGTVAGQYGYQSPDGSKVHVTYNAGGDKQHPSATPYGTSGSSSSSNTDNTAVATQAAQKGHGATAVAPSTYATYTAPAPYAGPQQYFHPSYYAAAAAAAQQGNTYGNPANSVVSPYTIPSYANAYPGYMSAYHPAGYQYQAQQQASQQTYGAQGAQSAAIKQQTSGTSHATGQYYTYPQQSHGQHHQYGQNPYNSFSYVVQSSYPYSYSGYPHSYTGYPTYYASY